MKSSISSNLSGLSFAEEQSLKVLPGAPVWYGLEPNTYSDLGATVTTVARTPINALRQQSKGTLIDLDAKGGFNSDLTQRNLTRLLQGFFFADALEKPATNPLNGAQVVITSVDSVNKKYIAAAGLNVFLTNHLVMAKGFGNSTNNGLFLVSATAAGFVQTLKVLVADAGPTAGTLETVGYQFPAGDLALTIVGNTIVLTSAAINPTTFGLTVGEYVYVGGDAAAEFYATGARFFGRVSAVSATQITFDLIIGGVPLADAGAGKTIRIFFGKMLRNATIAANIKQRSYQLERTLGNDGNGTCSEYVVGAVPNELTLNLGTAAKSTVDLTFVGCDVEDRDGLTGIKAGTRIAAPGEDAYNTSHDIIAQRISVIDIASANPAALVGYVSDLKLQVKNNVAPNKALGTLGAFDTVFGDFAVEGSATVFFGSIDAAKAVRANNDVCLTTVLGKQNSGMVVDVPLLGLGNGANKVEKDKSITTDLTTAAGKCAAGYTLAWTFFEYLPTVAMPV